MRKPKYFDTNLVVIGAGAGGLVASYVAAALRAKVTLIEAEKMGGDCLNTGCVPSKALIRSAKFLADAKRAKALGFEQAAIDFDFAHVMERVSRVVGKVEPHDSVDRYTALGVDCIHGKARITSPYTVEVNGRTLRTRAIIVATGAGPLVPRIPGLDQIAYLTSDSIWALRTLPKRLVVLGGGPIGCELAQCFARFGSQVTIVEMAERLLLKEDPEVSALIAQHLAPEGIAVQTGHKAIRFLSEDENKTLICDHGGKEVALPFDEILLALGRKANVKGFGLEELGVTLAKSGTIAADSFLCTNFPNIYVCGDVTGPYQFTHVAAYQATQAAVNALFSPFKRKIDYRVVPWATFTDPEVAHVGLNETEAKEKGIAYELTTYPLAELDRAITDEEDRGFVKVLTVPGKDEILGVTIVGAHASDSLAEFVLAMRYKLGLNQILSTIHLYPSFAEANRFAAGEWKKAHAPAWALSLFQKFHTWRRGTRKEKTSCCSC